MHGKQQGVLVIHRPVARNQAEGCTTERVQQRTERLVVHLAHEAASDTTAHHDEYGSDERSHGTSRQHRHCENDRR